MDEKPLFIIAKWFAGILALALVASLLVPIFGRTCERGNITKGISNCRQIITALHLYAADQSGAYPDGETANQVFRQLFAAEILDTEQIFSCPLSTYQSDNNIGSAPNFVEAVKPGENHWIMTKGLSDSSHGSIPLVFENSVRAEWPPMWNVTEAGKLVRGRSWENGKIIIGLNDRSASLQDLVSKSGTAVGLAPIKGEKLNLFEKAIDAVHFPVGKVLDVE